ncbi:MAG: RagB/SusD family nutrient uptake outer membrane protein [Alistipes sp.]
MKKILYTLVCVCFLMTSCEDFLNREPSAEVGSDTYFANEGSLLTYANGFSEKYTPSPETLGFGDGYSDILATSRSFTYLTNASWTPDLQGGWSIDSWKPIYNINYFLVHMREAQGVSEETFNHYEGVARFWRAWQYYEKMQTFGAVPWYDTPIDSEDQAALYKTRDSREVVMENLLKDLNFACQHCFTSSNWINGARINKYIALAFKARVCLYEGTYRKYHRVDPSTGKAWVDATASERYLRECAKACEDLMAAGVYTIQNNAAKLQTQYRDLFTKEAVNTAEVIWAREMSIGMTTYHDLTWRYTSGSYGERWSLDQDFVKTYLNLDGSRHTAANESFTTEVQNRDYRLKQSIVTPGYSKLVGGNSTLTPPDFTITLTGYQTIKYNIDDKAYESAKVSYNSLPILRYAEVLLNYAEAKAELGEFTADIWNKTIKVLRERAGVDGKRPTQADTYLATYYGISDCDLLEIRRERAIEMLLENLRYDDLMRWHLGEKLNKPWYGIYIAAMNTSYDLNDDGINDINVVAKGGEGKEPGVSYIPLGESYSLENGTSGRLIYSVGRNFEEKRYLRPIPKTALDINPDLGQNYYWK